jgi:hypothetical protein
MSVRRLTLLACALAWPSLVTASAALAHGDSVSAKPIVGTPRNDVLRGTNGADVIYGKAGNDVIAGLAGNDLIVGGPGADRIFCGRGIDTVVGDKRDFFAGNCEVIRGVPRPKPTPPPPPPLPPVPPPICLDRPATIVGTPGNDLLTGTPGSDVIAGLQGNDAIAGLGGNDVLCGDDGSDRLDGGDGADTLDSGPGVDVCLDGEAGENCSAPVVFTFQVPLTPDQQAFFRGAIGVGLGYLRQSARVAVDAFTLSVEATSAHGSTAEANAGIIHVFTESAWWPVAPSYNRTKILAHEYFHLVQYAVSLGRLGQEPTWLREGSAELVGWLAVGNAGLYEFATARAERIDEARRVSHIPLAQCTDTSSYECVYALGFLAVEHLIRGRGIPSLVAFWRLRGDGMPVETAFEQAFGRGLETFYAEFEVYRRTL